jgi:uncharacterized protein (DUF111 family)
MREPVHHQPSLAADLFGLWALPFELGAEWAAATAQLLGEGLVHHAPHAQLPVPEPIEAHDEHGLFA